MGLLARALTVWLGLACAELLHGVARSLLLAPRVGQAASKRWGVLSGSALAFGVAWLAAPWLDAGAGGQAWAVGALWALLMAAFDLSLARALGVPWRAALKDFDLREGGLLPLGLLAVSAAPWLVARLR